MTDVAIKSNEALAGLKKLLGEYKHDFVSDVQNRERIARFMRNFSVVISNFSDECFELANNMEDKILGKKKSRVSVGSKGKELN